MPLQTEWMKDQRIPVMMSTEEVDAIDEWRRKQEDLPSRSEAIRRLVAASLEATSKKGGGKK